MYKHISYLKDVIGQDYIGIKFTKEELYSILNMWKAYFSVNKNIDLINFIDNKYKRDGDHYHITLINAMEWKELKLKEELVFLEEELFKVIDDIEYIGIGRALKNDNETHFIVVESEELNKMRDIFQLKPIDKHITLGFDKKDVFGLDKGKGSIFIEL